MSATRTPGPSDASDFQRFLAVDWERWLDLAPEISTYVGAPGRNDRWNDDSDRGVAARRAQLSASRAELDKFRPDALTPVDRRDYDLYRELLVTTEAGLGYGIDPYPFRFGWPHNLWMPVSQMEGVATAAADISDIQPLTTVRDYEDLVARLVAFPEVVDANLARMADGLRRGYSAPQVPLAGLPDRVSAQLTDDPLASSILRGFREYPASVPGTDRERLTREAVAAYRDRVAPALRRLRDYLTQTYLPSARQTIGASALPNGAEFYAYLARWETTTELTPQQIHEIGLAEVHRIRGEMEAVKRDAGFSGSLAEFEQYLRTDPRFYYDSPEALLDGFRVIAKRIDPMLTRVFGRLPRVTYGVLPVPDYRAPTSPAAYYQRGSSQVGRPGYFYANTSQLDARPKWTMEALTLHEAVPGHHLQLALADEIEQLPEFRRHTGYTAFIEGWGLYAESLGDELGLYRDPYSKFGQLTFDVWRSMRLVVDTGMHALGWTRQQAIDYCLQHSGLSEKDIRVEVDRYIVWPGQALAYKIGQLRLRELRTRAEQRLGPRFDVRAFHDLVLGDGALPLEILSSRVDHWIASQAP